MTRIMLIGLLMALLCGSVGFAEPVEGVIGEHQKKAMEIQMRRQEMEIEAQEAEMDFSRQMQEFELDQRRAEIERPKVGAHGYRNPHRKCKGVFLLLCLFVHVLATILLYKDLQQTKASGLWIPIVLIAGLFGLLVYALMRMGDMCRMKHEQTA
jgi:hypothetical protein